MINFTTGSSKRSVATKSVAVWLFVKGGLYNGKIALQKRSEKEGGEIQSFKYVLQPTWNEKFEKGETALDAVERGAKEELGKNFKVPKNLKLFCEADYFYGGKPARGYNFVGEISEVELEKAELHKGAEPKFYFIGKNDLPNIKLSGNKGVNPEKELVMFKDQYKALAKLF